MMGFQSSCIMLGSSAEMCCAETLQIGFESFWVQLLKWVAYLELPKVGQNRKYVGNTLFIVGIFTIYSLQCMCASQILSLESKTMLAAHWWCRLLSVCSMSGCALARRCLEVWDFLFPAQSHYLWRQIQGNPASTCLCSSPGACWPLSSSQSAAGRDRPCFSLLTGGKTPEHTLWVCQGTNSMPGLRTEELFPRSPLITAVPFCDYLGFFKWGSSSFNTQLGVLPVSYQALVIVLFCFVFPH